MGRPLVDWYLRTRLIAALGILAVVTLASFAFDTYQSRQSEDRRKFAAALDVAIATMAEQLVHLAGIQNAIGPYLAADDRSSLRRSLPKLEGAIAELREQTESGRVSRQTHSLMTQSIVDPMGTLSRAARAAREVADDGDLWGESASFSVSVATNAVMDALPLTRRIKEIKEEGLARAAAKEKASRWIGLGIVLGLLLLIWTSIFRPMERRLRRDAERLRARRRQAEAASEAKSMFIATMSHEIRTPLVGVLGAAELLRGSRLKQDQAALVETVLGSGQALLGLLNDILDYSKIEAGQLHVARHAMDLAAIAGDLAGLFAPQAKAKGIALKLECSDALAAAHMGDGLRLRQVLANLVGNAVKFTAQGQVILRIEAAPAQGGRQAVTFRVEDTGIGMTQGQLSHVFEAFTQADGSTERRHGGTGLGLTIARRLTEAMGGRLSVESAKGQGTAFALDLLLDVTEEAPEATAPRPPPVVALPRPHSGTPPPADAPAAGIVAAPAAGILAAPAAGIVAAAGGLHVLIVDDNGTNRMIVQKMLQPLARQIDLACNGREAVESFQRRRPDLILMDISMPEMDGFQATRAIRAIEAREGLAGIPIAALTAHTGDGQSATALQAGCDAVLRKPFSRAEIVALVEKLPRRAA